MYTKGINRDILLKKHFHMVYMKKDEDQQIYNEKYNTTMLIGLKEEEWNGFFWEYNL